MKPSRLVRIYRSRAMRRRIYELLDDGTWHPFGILLHKMLIILVILSVAAVVLETEPTMQARFGRLFDIVEAVAVAAFTLEYFARLWCATEHPPYRDMTPAQARMAHVMTPAAIIDLVAIAPFYLALLIPSGFKIFIIFRLLRFFKLARYSPAMRTLFDTIAAEKRALTACLFILCGLALVSASVMYVAEHEVQPEKLGSIPDALYWAVITLTTVGYGDVSPLTPLGKVIAGVTALFGIVMLALPVGIIATSFAQTIQRRDFVVTWSMVSHVPLFARLSANDVAELMRYLQSQTFEPGEIIVKRGDIAHSMYFISSGEVEIDFGARRTKLGEGHFFGEVAIIKQARRSATVRALCATKMLVLDAVDLRGLMERRPEIARLIEREAIERLAIDDLEEQGDIIAAELPRER